MYLRIAGFTIQLTCHEPDLNLVLSPSTARFAIEPAPPDVSVNVASADLTDDAAGSLVFDSGGPWRLFRTGDGHLFRFFSSAFGPVPYKTAHWNHDFTRGEVLLNRSYFQRSVPVDPLEYPLDELLVINLLGRGTGLEIHGCGVLDASGDGYLFVGQSGAGKSTMARLWLGERGTHILSDDRVVLRAADDGVRMYGTPWHGEEPLASPMQARLTRVFFLSHGAAHATEPLLASQAAARLFAASFPPFHSAAALEFSLGFIARVVDLVPCRQLRFSPDASVIDFVRCADSGH